MRVSIVTVVFNNVDTIADTIESVQSQTYGEVEHIVIDGGSTDGTLEVLQNYRDEISVLVSEPDRGLYFAMNKGIALATGDIVGTLNGDDLYARGDALEIIVSNFADPDVDATYGNLVYVDRADTARIIRYWESREYEAGLFERGWIPAHPTFFVRRDIYQRFGLFDTRYRIQSDFELCMRFLRVHGVRSKFIPQILVRMRMGGVTNRSIGSILAGNLESYRACLQHGLAVNPVTFFAKKWGSRLPQFFRRPDRGASLSIADSTRT